MRSTESKRDAEKAVHKWFEYHVTRQPTEAVLPGMTVQSRVLEVDWKRFSVVGRIRWNEGVREKMKVVANANGLKEFR